MKYRYAGNSGLLVSRICLGTMTFGADGFGCDEETSVKIINRYLDAGGNFIDTADIYSGSRSESIIGKAIAGKSRDQFVLATKGFFRTGKTPTQKGSSRKHLMEACEASLRRLKTDYIDVYYVHGPDFHTPYDETMRALDDLVRQGKILYAGCSNFKAWEFVKANGTADLHKGIRYVLSQHMYNLIRRDVEDEVLPACRSEGMGFTAWSPLGGGLLTGKYRNMEKPAEGSRISVRSGIDVPRFWHARGFETAETLSEIADEHGIPASRLAIAWVLGDRRVTSVIIGVKSLEQLEDNLVPGDWDLPEEIYSEISGKTDYDRGYLPQFYAHAAKSTFGEEEFC